MGHKLVVSIINYKTPDMTLDCVRSVVADIGTLDVRVVIVDNASADGSVEQISDWVAQQPANTPVELVVSDVNSGFSGGHNQGMAAAQGDYYLLLNSDARLLPGCLAALLEGTETHGDAGLFAPQIEYEDGTIQESCFRFHSPFSELIRGANSGPVTRLLRRWDIPLGQHPDANAIGWASFACILLDGRMVDEIGPMDEGYFLYFEDSEYCLRARRAGWRIQRCPRARMIHYRGGSAPVKTLAKARARLPAYFYASRTRYFHQAYGLLGLWAANLMWTAGRGLAIARRLLGRKSDNAKAGEGRDIWINAMRPLTGPSYGPYDGGKG